MVTNRKKLSAPNMDKVNFYWSERHNQVQIYGPFGSAGARFLNEDEKVKEKVAVALKKIYRYSGRFEFEDDDIPF